LNQLRAVAVDPENIAVLEPCLATPAALRLAAVRRSELAVLRAPGLLDAKNNCAIVAIDIARPSVEAAADRDALDRGVARLTERWLLASLTLGEAASIPSSRKIAAIRALLGATAAQIRTPAPKLAWNRLLQLIFRQRCGRSGHLVVDRIAGRPGACALLKQPLRLDLRQAARRWRDTIVGNRKGLDLLCSDEHSGLPYPVSAPCAAAPPGAP
jgi:hypothetical protein